MKTNITIIGMAGVGKTFTSKYLSEKLGFDHIETDAVISSLAKDIGVDEKDLSDNDFINLEERAILSLDNPSYKVLDTGGSVIYSEKSMDFLKSNSTIIYLEDKLENIRNRFEDRTKNVGEVKIVGMLDKTFEELLNERIPLYEKYADVTVNIMGTNDPKKVLDHIIEKILPASSLD